MNPTRTPTRASRSGRWVALVCAGTLALGGCGGGEPAAQLSADEQTAADNLGAQIVTSGSVAGKDTVTAVEAGCVADGTVEEVGLSELQGYGIVTADLKVNKGIQGVEMSAEHADALAGVFVECIDTEKLFEEQLLASAGSGELTGKQEQCVRTAVDEKAVARVLSLSFQGETTGLYDELEKELAACDSGRSPGH